MPAAEGVRYVVWPEACDVSVDFSAKKPIAEGATLVGTPTVEMTPAHAAIAIGAPSIVGNKVVFRATPDASDESLIGVVFTFRVWCACSDGRSVAETCRAAIQ